MLTHPRSRSPCLLTTTTTLTSATTPRASKGVRRTWTRTWTSKDVRCRRRPITTRRRTLHGSCVTEDSGPGSDLGNRTRRKPDWPGSPCASFASISSVTSGSWSRRFTRLSRVTWTTRCRRGPTGWIRSRTCPTCWSCSTRLSTFCSISSYRKDV